MSEATKQQYLWILENPEGYDKDTLAEIEEALLDAKVPERVIHAAKMKAA